MEGETFLQEMLSLLPFFILHLSSGMGGSITTVLIEQYERTNKTYSSGQANEAVREAMIGTFQDIPPIIIAVLGGFLQQMFGPRNLLIVSAVPSILSWLLLAADPLSFPCILLSRLMTGFSNGLLTGNVYLANIASSGNISSLKMIEVSRVGLTLSRLILQLASKNVGSILVFVGMLTLQNLGMATVAGLFSVFPVIGLLGMVFSRESPIFHVRYCKLKIHS